MPKYTLERGGKTATVNSPRELTPEELSGLSAQYFGPPPEKGERDKAETPTTPESIQAGIFGAGQPQPLTLGQRLGNAVLPPLVTAAPAAALTAGGGALASKALPQLPRLAGAAGRAITSGLIGGAEAAAQGKSPVGHGLASTGIAAAFEALLPRIPGVKIPKLTSSLKDLAGRITERREQFKRATDAVDDAFNAITPRLPKGTLLYVPAIASQRIPIDEVRRGLKTLEGPSYDAARRQILSELSQLDRSAVTASAQSGAAKVVPQSLYSASEFGARTLPERFTPPSSAAERGAEAAVEALRNPGVRATADVIGGTDVAGLPAAAWPLALYLQGDSTGTRYSREGGGGFGLRGLAERLLR